MNKNHNQSPSRLKFCPGMDEIRNHEPTVGSGSPVGVKSNSGLPATEWYEKGCTQTEGMVLIPSASEDVFKEPKGKGYSRSPNGPW